jgi:hypothetical protein
MRPSLPSRLLLATLLALAAAGCPADPVGQPCVSTFECTNLQPFQSCYVPGLSDGGILPDGGLEFGFCSRTCDTAGSTEGCPGQSICADTAGTRLCAARCATSADCGPNAACLPVEGGVTACVFPPQG